MEKGVRQEYGLELNGKTRPGSQDRQLYSFNIHMGS